MRPPPRPAVEAKGPRPRPAAPPLLEAASPPRSGEWLWLCRAGSERDLIEDLADKGSAARPVAEGLVASTRRAKSELTFARQGLPVDRLVEASAAPIADTLRALLRSPTGLAARGVALHVIAADSDAGNRLAGLAQSLRTEIASALSAQGYTLHRDGPEALAADGFLAQVLLLSEGQAVCGLLRAREAPSLHPGGRLREKRLKGAPARSALKLSEALSWIGHGPESSEVCVDLGAAPGGWCRVLMDRGCHVIAVDPGALAPEVARGVEHLRMNAFAFAPELPADWLFCDMAYRPLEVAGLLSRWGRRRWAQFLVANIKLPMKQRVAMLARVREILESGGWTGLRFRQLYHDRDEVTAFAWRGFGKDTRPTQRRSPPSNAQPRSDR